MSNSDHPFQKFPESFSLTESIADSKAHQKTSAVVSVIMWTIALVLSFALTYYAAFALRTFWRWFIEPAGAEPLSNATSIGILTIAFLLKYMVAPNFSQNKDGKPDHYEALSQMCLTAFCITLSFGSAAIWKFWVL